MLKLKVGYWGSSLVYRLQPYTLRILIRASLGMLFTAQWHVSSAVDVVDEPR